MNSRFKIERIESKREIFIEHYENFGNNKGPWNGLGIHPDPETRAVDLLCSKSFVVMASWIFSCFTSFACILMAFFIADSVSFRFSTFPVSSVATDAFLSSVSGFCTRLTTPSW
jgi:hypothetical protein